MAMFGNKMMVFEGNSYGSSMLVYQTFKNTVADLTGLNTPTTLNPFYVNGLYSGLPNESFFFPNPGNTYVKIPNNTRFTFENKKPFSIVMAVNLTTVTGNRWLMQKRTSGDSSTAEYQVNVNNGELRVSLFDAMNGGSLYYSLGNLIAGVNYVIQITYDSVNEIICKINNVTQVIVKTTTGTFISMRETTSWVELFNNHWSGSISGKGTLDTFAMFNKNLTSAEMTDIYTKITTNQSLL